MTTCPPDMNLHEFGAKGVSIQKLRCRMTQQGTGGQRVGPHRGLSPEELGQEQPWNACLWARAGITPMLQLARAVLKDPEDPTQCFLLFANQVGLFSSVLGHHSWVVRTYTNGPILASARGAPCNVEAVLLGCPEMFHLLHACE